MLEAYELARQDSQLQAQSRVSHILFETDTEDEVSERIAKAQEKLANGESFADVARELSDDVGSADKGGDLGYTSGNTFPETRWKVLSRNCSLVPFLRLCRRSGNAFNPGPGAQ